MGGRVEGGGKVGRCKKGLDLLFGFLEGIKLGLIFSISNERREEGGRMEIDLFFGLVWFGLA